MNIINNEPAAIKNRFAKITRFLNGKRELTMAEFHKVTDYAFFNTHGYNYNREGYPTDDVENIIKLVEILENEIINNNIPKFVSVNIDENQEEKREQYTEDELKTNYITLKGTEDLFKFFISLNDEEKNKMLEIQKEFKNGK